MPNKLEARVTQHDREIAAIRKLLLQGAKMLLRIEAAQQRADKRIDALDKRIDALASTVDRFIRSLKRGGSNGHKRYPLNAVLAWRLDRNPSYDRPRLERT